jgi:Flp pilus assembly protein TadD
MLRHARFVGLSLVACGVLAACQSGDPLRSPTFSTNGLLHVAETADASGDSDLAASMYGQAAASDPSNVDLQLRYVDALTRQGNTAEARQMLTERLRARPGQPDLLRALALIDLVSGEPAKAIDGLDKVLAASPGDSKALVDKAVALDLQGQHAAAQAIYRQVLTASPMDPATLNNLALSQMLDGHAHQALETLMPMQGAQNVPQRLKVNLGILYAATGDLNRSQQLLGDRLSTNDVSALTQALSTKTTERPMSLPE